MSLTDEQIRSLYAKKQRKPSQARAEKTAQGSPKYRPIVRNPNYLYLPDNGPVRMYDDHSHRCASKRCGSPTYYKLRGVPYCAAHLIMLLATEVANNGSSNTSGAGVATSPGSDGDFTGSLTSEGTL